MDHLQEMMMMMVRLDHLPHKPIIVSTPPTWKLYQNPFYKSHHHSSITNPSSSSSFLMDSDLEYERTIRKKLESLSKRLAMELEEERKRREAMEGLCEELARKIDRMKKEMEEERKMMKLAEVLREERVQMKIADLKVLFEDRLEDKEEKICKFSGKMNQRRFEASPERENPHIVRGIKGFVEFPRVVRGNKGLNLKRRDCEAKLECQKAQLRVLLKQKGTLRSNNDLIIS